MFSTNFIQILKNFSYLYSHLLINIRVANRRKINLKNNSYLTRKKSFQLTFFTMTESNYNSPDPNNNTTESPQDKKKRHPDYIALQRVVYALSTFRLLKLYVNVMIILTTTKFVLNIIEMNSNDKEESSLEGIIYVCIKLFQIFGYAYGLQAYVSKSLLQAKVFQGYIIISFFIVGYYAYYDFQDEEWFGFALGVFNFNFNILLLITVRKFINLLHQRDSLKESLEKLEQP